MAIFDIRSTSFARAVALSMVGIPVGVLFASPASAAPARLRMGDSGSAVTCMQRGINYWLTDFNKDSYPMAVDGNYGAGTRSRVNYFKKRYGLNPDGVFGKAAGERLIKASRRMPDSTVETTNASVWRVWCADKIPRYR